MDKRDKILEAALKLFVEYGFHGTPTSKIAGEAGVSNGTLFHWFKTKEELILALYDIAKNDWNEFLVAKIDANQPLEMIAKMVMRESVYWALAHPQQFHYIQQIYFSPFASLITAEQSEKYMALHLQMIELGQENGIIKQLPVDLIIVLINSQIYGICQYLQQNTLDNPSTIIDKAVDLTWGMIAE